MEKTKETAKINRCSIAIPPKAVGLTVPCQVPAMEDKPEKVLKMKAAYRGIGGGDRPTSSHSSIHCCWFTRI